MYIWFDVICASISNTLTSQYEFFDDENWFSLALGGIDFSFRPHNIAANITNWGLQVFPINCDVQIVRRRLFFSTARVNLNEAPWYPND